MSVALALAEARRLAIASQGFSARPAAPSATHLRKLAATVHAFQIDSVNVVVRAHYVPAFARLGAYPTGTLDALTYRKRELFEYWGHAACLLPIALYPLVRYRMRDEQTREYMRSERGAAMAKAYQEVVERVLRAGAGPAPRRPRAGRGAGPDAGVARARPRGGRGPRRPRGGAPSFSLPLVGAGSGWGS